MVLFKNPKTRRRFKKNPFAWLKHQISKRWHKLTNYKYRKQGLGVLLLTEALILKHNSPVMIDNIRRPRSRPAKIRRILRDGHIEVTFTEHVVKDLHPLKSKEFVPGYTRPLPHKKVKQFVVMDIETHEVYALAPNQYTHKTIAIKEGTVIPYIVTEKGYVRYNSDSDHSIGNVNPNMYKHYIHAISGVKSAEPKGRTVKVDFVIKFPK